MARSRYSRSPTVSLPRFKLCAVHGPAALIDLERARRAGLGLTSRRPRTCRDSARKGRRTQGGTFQPTQPGEQALPERLHADEGAARSANSFDPACRAFGTRPKRGARRRSASLVFVRISRRRTAVSSQRNRQKAVDDDRSENPTSIPRTAPASDVPIGSKPSPAGRRAGLGVRRYVPSRAVPGARGSWPSSPRRSSASRERSRRGR